MRQTYGVKNWAIPEGYIPSWSHGPEPQFTSHETVCILNTSNEMLMWKSQFFMLIANLVDPYHVSVQARRTKHVRFNDLTDPEPIPLDTDFASLIESDIPIIVQHTRLDSRQAENALLSTIAHPLS